MTNLLNIKRTEPIANKVVLELLPELSVTKQLEYADEWEERLKALPNNHIDRSHAWRMMTACRVAATGISDVSLERIRGNIPTGDENEHVKRCAFISHYIKIPGMIDTDVIENVFQPWYCRDWKILAAIKVETSLSITLRGHAGCAWWMSHRLESDEDADEHFADLAENLSQACNQEREKNGKTWTQVVGSGCDVWQQRTGIILQTKPPVMVVRPKSATANWKSPRTVLNAKKDELRQK